MPVLPDVGSRITRPGRSSPEASAASIIALAMRSFVEPVGFWPSSLSYSRTPGFGDIEACRRAAVADRVEDVV
jgi:hypothetical protein